MKFLRKILTFLLFLGITGGIVAAGGLVYIYKKFEPELPSTETLREVRLQVPLRVYSRDGKLMAEYGEKRRIPLSYDEIPQQIRQAFLAAEDDRFFEHPGVDYQGLVRAAVQLALTGKRRQGGSTITMQLARNFFLSREKTYTRKLKEIFLALRIERDLSKEEILTLYLNKIYLGHRAYGIGAAARVYYGRTVDELELPQIAMIAGLPKAPSTTNPLANPDKAIKRRAYVLDRMLQLGFIDAEQHKAAKASALSAEQHRTNLELDAPYVAEMARSDAVERFGDQAYTRGLTVHTTVDSRLQAAAITALRDALQAYDKRHGYRGSAGHKPIADDTSKEQRLEWAKQIPSLAGLERGLVETVDEKNAGVLTADGDTRIVEWNGLKWARTYVSENRRKAAPKKATDILKPGDLIYMYEDKDKKGEPYWRLAQGPAAEGALVAMDPSDGSLRALVGGYDFYRSKFNRATQAKRQPGSGFKAFIYSAALEGGFTPASLINDAPLVVHDASLEGSWRPENYSGKWFGPTRLRKALYKSRNLVSIRLLRSIGVEFALEHAARFGFDPDKLPGNLSLALGSGEVTPIQMARGYSVLANGGYLIEPHVIERIEDTRDGVLFQAEPATICSRCPDEPPTELTNGEMTAEAATDTDEAEPATIEAATADMDDTDSTPRHAPRVLNARNQYLMTSMMKDVIQRGTGVRAKTLGRKDLAGKTGTTNDQRDAWFNGFNRSLVASVWVGLDSYKPLGRGEVGGKAALPAWIDFMRTALDGVPEQSWDMPDDIVTVRIDPETGQRAPTGDKNAIFEVFRKENEPAKSATDRSGTAVAGGTGRSSETLTQELF